MHLELIFICVIAAIIIGYYSPRLVGSILLGLLVCPITTNWLWIAFALLALVGLLDDYFRSLSYNSVLNYYTILQRNYRAINERYDRLVRQNSKPIEW
jgi:hypothetical protein